MKFATKVILGTTIIISILFSIGSSIMIRKNFKVFYEASVEQNTKQHILYRYSIESNIRNTLENNNKLTKDILVRSIDRLVSYGEKSELMSVIWNNDFVYSDIDALLIDEEVKNYYNNINNSYLVKEIGDSVYMYLASEINVSDESIILLNTYDITSNFLDRSRQNNYYIKWFLIIVLIYIFTVSIFVRVLIKPIKNLNETSKRISRGNYKERTNIKTSDEIGELSRSFDMMTDSIEEHINKLEKDIKDREEFISDFSHELKTPMTSMRGYSKLLMQGNCSEEIQKKSAKYIYSECKRLEILSKKLLMLMEINEGPIELVSISTEWLKEKIEDVMEPLLENKKVQWINAWDSCYIKGDAQLIIDLLKNLIENGIKASMEECYICIQGKKNNNLYEISVTDHGCGIEQNEIEKIKNHFYMIDKSRAKAQGSSGLGLSICDKIAKAHNTELSIISNIGKGTMVSIQLEVENEEEIIY